jgi:hypothetical protein
LTWTCLIFLAIACGREGEPVDNNQESGEQPLYQEVTLKARIEDSMTKVSYTSGGSVWNGGDQITAIGFNEETNACRRMQFSSIEDGNQITFHGFLPAGFTLMDYAIYPFSSKHLSGMVDGTFTLGVYNGDISAKNIGEGPVQMIGVRDQDGVYVFRHCAGAIRLSLVNMPSGEVEVTLTANENTLGQYKVDMSTLKLIHSQCDLGSKSFSVKTHADDKGNAVVYFPLPEGKYTGISFTVKDNTGGEIMTQSFPDPVNVKVGKFNDLSMELVIDTTADFSRWMRSDTTFVNCIETEDLAQHGQLLNGCDTLFYMHDSKTLYGYISVPITTASLQAQLRELHVYIDHCDDQTTQFNPNYDLGWLDQHAHYDLRFDGKIYQSGRIRKIEDSPVILHKICPTQQPEESFGWMGGVTRGNSTQETIDHGFRGSGVLEALPDNTSRFRYQFELDRDVALITVPDLQTYSWEGVVTGIVNVMVVVSDPSYSHSSICPDREGTDLYMLN